jgi:hypothetical protein
MEPSVRASEATKIMPSSDLSPAARIDSRFSIGLMCSNGTRACVARRLSLATIFLQSA